MGAIKERGRFPDEPYSLQRTADGIRLRRLRVRADGAPRFSVRLQRARGAIRD